MDPWTLAYLADHRNMNITKRYIHPQEQTIQQAMEKARAVKGRHNPGHNAENPLRGEPVGSTAIN